MDKSIDETPSQQEDKLERHVNRKKNDLMTDIYDFT